MEKKFDQKIKEIFITFGFTDADAEKHAIQFEASHPVPTEEETLAFFGCDAPESEVVIGCW